MDEFPHPAGIRYAAVQPLGVLSQAEAAAGVSFQIPEGEFVSKCPGPPGSCDGQPIAAIHPTALMHILYEAGRRSLSDTMGHAFAQPLEGWTGDDDEVMHDEILEKAEDALESGDLIKAADLYLDLYEIRPGRYEEATIERLQALYPMGPQYRTPARSKPPSW